MPLANESLKNTYYALRHGHSVANEQGIIISDPASGKNAAYGLTELGRRQVESSIRNILNEHPFGDKRIVIVHSPFSRTLETAVIAKNILGVSDELIETGDLRERHFGQFEGKSNVHYQTVWDLDANDPHHTTYDVESVASVRARQENFIHGLERQYDHIVIILSGHGDPLQILETSLRGMDPSQHRQLEPLQNGELRLLHAM